MLIDIHSHFFRSPDHFSKDFMGQAKRAAGGGPGLKLDVLWEDYHSEAKECDWTVVFGGKAALAGLWVPDDEIVEYTKSHADKTIGSSIICGSTRRRTISRYSCIPERPS